MDREDLGIDIYDPSYWARQLPEYPYPERGGQYLALEPQIAGKILVKIAQGLHPRASFAMFGISKFTYKRYLKRANNLHAGASNALPEYANQAGVDRYLFGYFVLQSTALEIAGIQFAHAQMKLLQGAPTSDFYMKTVKKDRSIIRDGRLITLTDTTTTKSERYKRGAPRLSKYFMEQDEFEPGVETVTEHDFAQPEHNFV